jgi:hypothetical protein
MTQPLDEKSALATLLHTLRPRWANRSIDDAFEECVEQRKAWKELKRQQTKLKFERLREAYELYLLTEQRKGQQQLRQLFRNAGLQLRSDSHLLSAIIRGMIEDEHDTANRWSTALRYALIHQMQPDKLIDFIKAEGGIEKCVDKFRALTRKKRPTPIRPPTRKVPPHSDRDQFRKDKSRGSNAALILGGARIASDETFERDLRALAQRRKNLFVQMQGHVSPERRLTLEKIEVDELRMEKAKVKLAASKRPMPR